MSNISNDFAKLSEKVSFPLCRRPASRTKVVPIGSPETPVINYDSTARKLLKSSDPLGLCFVNKTLCHLLQKQNVKNSKGCYLKTTAMFNQVN